jgi:protein gp37
VIVGGESGPKARDCDLEWVRSLEEQCYAALVPCFIKQLGRQPRVSVGVYLNLRDRKGGDLAEWPSDLRVREWPAR